MLVIQAVKRLAADAKELPSLTVVGFGVMALAGVMEVLLFLAAGSQTGHMHGGFAPERGAPLLGITGMVITLAGVVIEAARHPSRRSSAPLRGSDSHAHR